LDLPDVAAQVLEGKTYKTIEVPAFAIESVKEGFQGQGVELAVT
jgi:hypothetical protein